MNLLLISTTMGFRPDIEGLRAIAILLVVAYHARLPGASGGFIGVDVFFVLSGYLITGLLAIEVERTGRPNFRRFYARRARRLVPAAAAVLITTIIVGRFVLSPLELKRLGNTAFATAIYVSNLYFIRQATNYQAGGSQDNPLLHTWSLAVEEQFYLVWPFLILVAAIWARRDDARRKLAMVLGAVGVVSFVASVGVTWAVQPWAFFGSPFRAWEFAFGGVAVVLQRSTGSPNALAPAVGWAGFAGVLIGAASFGASTAFPGVAALVPAVGTTLVLVTCQPSPSAGVGRLLGLWPLQRIGKLSYSWYLWHWPVLVIATTLGLAVTTPQRLVCAALSLGLAALTFRLIEDPIRHHRALLPRPGLTLSLAACLTLLGAGVSLVARYGAERALETPEQMAYVLAAETEHVPDGCQRIYLDVDGQTCEFGDRRSTSTVMLFGDSHATQWVPAFDRLGRQKGWRIRLLAKSDCPSASVDVFSPVLHRAYTECTRWRDQVFSEVAASRPAMVVVTNSQGYPGGRDSPTRTSFEDWREGLQRTFRTLAQTGTQVVLIRDSPRPGFRVPECLSRAAFSPFTRTDPCTIDRNAAVGDAVFAVERHAAAAFPRVAVLDLTDAFCGASTCPPVLAGTVVYRDMNHMTSVFSAGLATSLGRALDAVDRRGRGP